jgi:hypothetical protein
MLVCKLLHTVMSRLASDETHFEVAAAAHSLGLKSRTFNAFGESESNTIFVKVD